MTPSFHFRRASGAGAANLQSWSSSADGTRTVSITLDTTGAQWTAFYSIDGDPSNASDHGKIHSFTDGSTGDLVLALAVRENAPAFSGSP